MGKKRSPNPYRHNTASQRRRQKRRDHQAEDIVDCRSITELNFFCEPKKEAGELVNVNPYESIISSDDAQCSQVWLKQKQTTLNSTPQDPHSEAQQLEQVSLAGCGPKQDEVASPRVTEWDMLKKWDEYSVSSGKTASQRVRSQAKRRSLCPSPLARNVGNLLQNLGYVAVDFFIHLCRLTSKAGSYQGPIGVLMIIVCVYFSLAYVEVSIANIAEIGLDWVWPCIHTTLRFMERMLRSATNLVQSVDELGESMVCDWAHLWCLQFNLMCHQRCSFTARSLDRFRYPNQA